MRVSQHNIQYSSHQRLANGQLAVGVGEGGGPTVLHPAFWNKVRKTADCWLWIATCSGVGYGQFTVGRKSVGAHRFSWELHHGPIPPGLFVLHHCDTRHCVNPDHLFLGTPGDNARDAVRKGRFFAPRPTLRRFTDAEVAEIRRVIDAGLRPGQLSAIARRFRVGANAIWRIGRRLTYRFPVGTSADQMAAIALRADADHVRRSR